MSWYPRRQVIDGNRNVFKNLGTILGGSITPAASTPAEWDDNENLRANNTILSWTTQNTSGTPFPLTAASAFRQTYTGTTNAVVELPPTCPKGLCFYINNASSGLLTLQAPDTSIRLILHPGTDAIIWAEVDNPTSATQWGYRYYSVQAITGKVCNIDNTLTLAGTDNTIITFPPESCSVAAQLSTTAIKTAAYTAAADEFVLCDASGGAFPVTLPPAPYDGANVVIKKLDSSTNAVTFAAGGSDVINAAGITSGALTSQYQPSVRLQYAAASETWYVISIAASSQASTVVEYTTTTTGITVPTGVTGVWIERLIQAGSGGGSGRRGASGTVCCGGGGGSSGAVIADYFVPVSRLGATCDVTLPPPGTGGAAVTADNTNGNSGTASAAAMFSSGSFAVSTFAGTGGLGGTNALGTGGALAQGLFNGSAGGSASTTGGVGGLGSSTTNGAPAGGGAGGGITTAPAASNGGAGGRQTLQYGGTSAAGGVVDTTAPSTGNAAVPGVGGMGGGGGAASITGPAQAGATPTGYGAGGAGGGASLNGNNSGAGGNGGPPYCRLRWVYV